MDGSTLRISAIPPRTFYIKRGLTIENYEMRVLYDHITPLDIYIPRNSIILGDWVSLPNGTGIQFIAKTIEINGIEHEIVASSPVIGVVTLFNRAEVFDVPFIEKVDYKQKTVNYFTRIAYFTRPRLTVDGRVQYTRASNVLADRNLDTIYYTIPGKELRLNIDEIFFEEPIPCCKTECCEVKNDCCEDKKDDCCDAKDPCCDKREICCEPKSCCEKKKCCEKKITCCGK